MILTITIDTHPHTNALIEGQVKRALEDFLADRHLGTVVASSRPIDLAYVAERLSKANDLTEGGTDLDDLVASALEEVKGFLK